MSAFMMDRESFLKIGAFVAKHTPKYPVHDRLWCYMPDREYDLNRYTPERVATVLQQQNSRSVNDLYGNDQYVRNITADELQGVEAPTPGELGSLLACLSYQSCETDDWRTCEGRELIGALRELALKVVGRAEGVEGWV